MSVRRPHARITHLIIFCIFFSIWYLITEFHLVSNLVIPSPFEVVNAFNKSLGPSNAAVPPLAPHLVLTLEELAFSYGIVMSVGLGLGFVIGLREILADTLGPLIVAFFAIPSVVLYPILFLLLGIGDLSKVAFGVIVGLYPVIENTISGVSAVKDEHLRIARASGANDIQIFTKIILPSSLPLILAGARLGFSLTLIGIIAAELIAAEGGLGYLINQDFSLFNIPQMYSIMIIVILIALTGNYVFSLLEQRTRRVGFRLA